MSDTEIKIIAFSDSHGRTANVEKILPQINAADYCFFLGDGLADFQKIKRLSSSITYAVKGNCDFMHRNIVNQQVVSVGDINVFLTHGHMYGVKDSVLPLIGAAKESSCQLALFGHSHIPEVFSEQNITFVNPGSISLPRFGVPTYAEIFVNGKNIVANIVELP